MSALQVEMPESCLKELEEISREKGVPAGRAAGEMLQRLLTLRRFRRLAGESERYFREAGFTSEEEILKSIS